MTKEAAEKSWIELSKIHRKLVLQNYSTMGEHVNAHIKRAERAVKAAMDSLKPTIEGA